MNLRAYKSSLLGVIMIVAVLGMPVLLLSPMNHETHHCPFMAGQTTVCSTGILEHMSHWQSSFATILMELLVLGVLVFFALWQFAFSLEPEISFARVRQRTRTPMRPKLLQELFSQGILNPKTF